MECTKFRKLIDAVIDNEAAHIEQDAVMAHVKTCPSCRTALSNLRTLSSMIRNSYSSHSDIDVTDSVMARIRSKQSASVRSPRPVRRRPTGRYIVAAAAGLIVAVAAFSAVNSNGHDTVASSGDRLEPYVLEHVDRTTVTDVRSRMVTTVRFED